MQYNCAPMHSQQRTRSQGRRQTQRFNGRGRQSIAILCTFVVFPVLLSKSSNAAAQDIPLEQVESVREPQSPVYGSQQQVAPISERENACADASGACDSQNMPTDPATTQGPPQTQSNLPRNDRFIHDFVGDFFHDQYRMWTGPFRPSNYDSHVMKKYGLPFLLISGTLIATDRQTAHWFENSNSQVKWSGRVSQIGAPYTVAGFSAATYLIGRATKNRRTQETGFLALEAVADSEFITLVMKEVTQRRRPAEGTQNRGFWQGGTSFPSGHAAGSFAVAAVFSYEYHDHIAVPIAAYTVATIVDISRLGAQQHWLSDLFVGSAVGFLSGRYVFKQHHDPNVSARLTSRLLPEFAAREQGLGLYWDF
jgi:membrane-associated phospholipid phosphatase